MNQPLTAAVRYLSGEREPVRAATTGNLSSMQGLLVIDDVELEVGDRVLVKDQTDATKNGIWLASEGVWFRAPDASYTRAINEGVTVSVQEGTANHGRTYRFSSANPVVGTDAITLTYFLSDTLSEDVTNEAIAAVQPFVDQAEEAAAEALAAASSLQPELDSRAYAISSYHPLIAPNKIRVAGYASAGDGGAALYKKVSSEPSHAGKFSVTLTPSGTAWYEIAEDELRPEMFGCVGDGVAVDQTALANAVAVHSELEVPLNFVGGKSFAITGTISDDQDYIDIRGDFSCRIVSSQTSGVILAIGAGRSVAATKTLAANAKIGTKVLNVGTTTGVQAGDVFVLTSNKAWYNDPRENTAVGSGAISLTSSLGTTTSAFLDLGAVLTSAVVGQSITFTTGANAGYSRRITNYNNTLRRVDFAALPSAVASGVRYVIPEATKGETGRVARIIDGSTIETVEALKDGYYVQDGTAANVKEEVSVQFRRPYSPSVVGVTIEGPASVTTNAGLSISDATDINVNIRYKNCRSAGGQISRCHQGYVKILAEGSARVETGYGTQLSSSKGIHCDGQGWNNRRVFDVSGFTPSDDNIVSGVHADSGGLQADGSAYYPVGAVDTYGVGSHGPARDTIYRNCTFSTKYGVYERGRGAIIHDCRFEANVKYPIFHAFGGRLEAFGNVVDARVYSTVQTTSELNEVSAFGSGSATDAYAECFVVIGANLLSLEPNSEVIVRNNVVRSRKNLVQFETTGGTTRVVPNLSTYGNDVEFFPSSTSDQLATYGKYTGSSAGVVLIEGGKHNNRMSTASANQKPIVFGTEVQLTTTTNSLVELGDNNWSVRLADDTAITIPVSQSVATKLRVEISLDEDDTNFWSGWVKKGAAVLQTAGGSANFEALAVEPTGLNGTDGRCQLYYTDGKLMIGHRLSGNRSFRVYLTPMG